jgi:tRNA pseudouridine13 synthase
MTDLPFLTNDLPGVGGRIKEQIDDFEVEEIPAYEPCSSGDHIFLWIEKRDLGAEFFVRELAKRLGIRAGDIGTAGLKDRRAVTRQWVSIPASGEAALSNVDGDGIRVLSTSRHTNKLRPGHLRGNRFRILIRGSSGNPEPILARIRDFGLPNFYGPQRFGRDGETAALGMALLHREPVRARNPFLKKLALSAAQSELFNEYLARRMTDGLMRTVLAGDVLAKWPAGGMFVSQDPAAEQPRLDAREVVPAGPMFGHKLFPADAEAAEREAAVLRDAELSVESFAGFGKLLAGTRRHNLVYVPDLEARTDADGVRLTFTLPAGSYATILLREVMKEPLDDVEVNRADHPSAC